MPGRVWTGKDVLFTPISLNEIAALVDECSKILKGRHPAVQGAVLADLTAIWLNGHQCDMETKEEFLKQHTEHVREVMKLGTYP